jgi:BMFP domain-containing protein YqiC
MGRAFSLCTEVFFSGIATWNVNYKGALMQTQNKFLEDISKVMTNAMGVAQGAKTEAETAMKSWMDRWLADRDFVSREEFDAVRLMAQKAREENVSLLARLDALEAKCADGA